MVERVHPPLPTATGRESRRRSSAHMARSVSPPLLVFEGGDLSIFRSLAEVESALEGIDVEDGVYEAFDSAGRVVSLKASGVVRGQHVVDIGRTRVESVETLPTAGDRLKRLLHEHLGAIGRAMPIGTDLRDLVAACQSLHKHER